MSPVTPQSPQSPHPPQPSPSAKAPLPARTPRTAPRISRSPQTPAPEPSGQRPRSPRVDEPGGQRPSRLIHNESTTEIPVHLLFREDASGTPVPAEPAVVRRRQASGEQPRTPSGGRGPRRDGRAAAGDFQERPGAAAERRERAFEQGDGRCRSPTPSSSSGWGGRCPARPGWPPGSSGSRAWSSRCGGRARCRRPPSSSWGSPRTGPTPDPWASHSTGSPPVPGSPRPGRYRWASATGRCSR